MIVVPRASLLWNPNPRTEYSSVDAVGTKTIDAFGLTMPALLVPEFGRIAARDVERVRRPREPDHRAELGSQRDSASR